jgi:hypothetical protein
VLMVLHIGVGGPLVLPLVALWAAGAGIALARLRGVAISAGAAGAPRSVQLRWLACAAAMAVAGLLVGAASAVMLPRADRAALIVLAIAPPAVAACFWAAAFARTGPGAAAGRIIRGAAMLFVAVVAFGIADTLLAQLFQSPSAVSVGLAGLLAAVAVALARQPLARGERALMRNGADPVGGASAAAVGGTGHADAERHQATRRPRD